MRSRFQNLSPRAELLLVTTICFAYPIIGSAYALLSGIRVYELTTGRVLRAIVVELLSLAGAGAILHVRGWTLDRLGLRFSWKAALAGVPLFILYTLLYAMMASMVMRLAPGTQTAFVSMRVTAPFALLLVWLVINSFFEELAVTAYVVEALSRESVGYAITASALLRFAYHLYQGPLASISILPLGFLFATLYSRYRNVWPLVVAHTIANVVAFAFNR